MTLFRAVVWMRRFGRSCVMLGAAGLLACSGGEELTGGLGPPPRGMLAVGLTGVPEGAAPSVTVSGPDGFTRAIAVSDTLRGLVPGRYSLSATDLNHLGHTWSPTPASQSVSVLAPGPAAEAVVAFELVTGGLAITVAGLPEGTPAALTLTGPGGLSRSVAATATLVGLPPGSYALTGTAIPVGASTWVPTLPTPVTVQAGIAPATVIVTYARQVGSLDIGVTGLPAGVPCQVRVTGPGGFLATLGGSSALTDLDPGDYTITADSVRYLGHTWRPALPSQSVAVSAGSGSSASVGYAIATGGLTVAVAGLPSGAAAAIAISGPGGFAAGATGTQAWVGVAPGTYLVSASTVAVDGQEWQPAPASQSIQVTAGTTSFFANVTYSLRTGTLEVAVTGLPGGTSGALTVTGPGGFSQAVTSSRTLSGLVPGSYLIAATAVSGGGHEWQPAPVSQTVAVVGGGTRTATVSYTQGTGSLTVAVTGLPGGTGSAISITGPAGSSRQVTATSTITGLAPGSYTVTASAVTSGANTWDPAPASQTTTIVAAGTSTASVGYSLRPPPPPPPPSLNLRIDGLYLTQAAQRYDGTAPLVAGRDAYLRVFVIANEANTIAPAVRVRLYNGATLVQTWTLAAPGASVPLAPSEGTLTTSWNVLVPASLIQPGLRVVADVDPAGAIAEGDETDNAFPASGAPAPVDVRAVPTFAVRFVPVLQQVNGLQGSVSDANKAQYLADVTAMLPIAGSDADVRAPYTTTAPVLQSDNANGAWGTILSEVLALRTADGNARYYYGVVRTAYSSGVAGIGYLGGGARTALGWDRLPSGSGVMAHELGHNMGRSHAPCGGVSGADPSYPYAGGGIGIWGLQVTTLSLKSPATYKDLMGYCSPSWVSDYNWAAMVSYRQGGPNNVAVAEGQGGGEGLLVWGRITPAGLVLEPAFVVDAVAALPAPGPHRIELIGSAGSVVQSIPFRAAEVHDLPGGPEEAFAFVLPVDRAMRMELTSIRLQSGGRVTGRRVDRADAAAAIATDPRGGSRIQWDASRVPMLLVRDGATGQILSFARGGEVRLPVLASRIRVTRPEMK